MADTRTSDLARVTLPIPQATRIPVAEPTGGTPPYVSRYAEYGDLVLPDEIILEKLLSDPVAGPGAGKVRLYVVEGGTVGTATLRVQAGTNATPVDIIVNFGSGF